MNIYLRSFVIGSSIIAYGLFLAVTCSYVIPNRPAHYTCFQYALVAPLYFGALNALSMYYSTTYTTWTLSERMHYTAILSGVFVPLFSYVFSTYDFSQLSFIRYACSVFVMHYFTWNIIIYYLELNV